MNAYHNSQHLKDALLSEVAKHRAADQLIKGTYELGHGTTVFKGCSVGCSINSLNTLHDTDIRPDDHKALGEAIGVPEELIRLQDNVFEDLPDEQSMLWPEQFYSAINPGTDLSKVNHQLLVAMIEQIATQINPSLFPAHVLLVDQCVEYINNITNGITNSPEDATNLRNWASDFIEPTQYKLEQIADKITVTYISDDALAPEQITAECVVRFAISALPLRFNCTSVTMIHLHNNRSLNNDCIDTTWIANKLLELMSNA